MIWLIRATGQATRRRAEGHAYRCFLSDLAGFAGFCRAGPTRRLFSEDTSGSELCQSSLGESSFEESILGE